MRHDSSSEAGHGGRRERIVASSVAVEAVTGVALLVDPALVSRLLLGDPGTAITAVFERCFGISLLALGLACWPSRGPGANFVPAFRAMIVYNVLVALYLAYAGAVEGRAGVLLWPAVAFHVVVTVLLLWTGRGGSAVPTSGYRTL